MRAFTFVLLAISSCASAEEVNLGSVSMVQLIVTPERFVGARLKVPGYLRGGQLFLTRDHAELRDDSSSIVLTADFLPADGKSPCGNALVWVMGKFIETKPGATYMLDVSQIFLPSSRTPCYRKPDAAK